MSLLTCVEAAACGWHRERKRDSASSRCATADSIRPPTSAATPSAHERSAATSSELLTEASARNASQARTARAGSLLQESRQMSLSAWGSAASARVPGPPPLVFSRSEERGHLRTFYFSFFDLL